MNKVSGSVVTQSILDKALEKQSKVFIDEVVGVVDIFVTKMDKRFNKIKADITELRSSHQRLIKTIDRFLKRPDQIETEQTARDAEMRRIKTWVKQIADENGVQLKGFSG